MIRPRSDTENWLYCCLPHPLTEIDADIKEMEEKIIRLLREVTA